MKRTFAPAGLLFMGLMIGLATLGLVVGMWSKVLDINGNVTTGGINAEVQFVEANDDEADPKGVADCNADAVDSPDLDGEKNDKLQITITNAYPEYECVVTFNVANTGKIPISVLRPNSATTNPWVKVGIAQVAGEDDCYDDGDQLRHPTAPGGIGEKSLNCSMVITVNQTDDQGNLLPQNQVDPALTFQTSICYYQFNADPTAAECKAEAKNDLR